MALVSVTLARASQDEWRLLAWAPVLPLAAWALYIAVGVTRDPTSHNLWPFELVIWATLSLLLLAGFLTARHFLGGPRDDWASRRERDRVQPDKR